MANGYGKCLKFLPGFSGSECGAAAALWVLFILRFLRFVALRKMV